VSAAAPYLRCLETEQVLSDARLRRRSLSKTLVEIAFANGLLKGRHGVRMGDRRTLKALR